MTAFVNDPRRDAAATIRGFVFQVDLTIQRWLELGENEALELEAGEDIDTVARGFTTGEEEGRILEQVKSRTSSLTLRAPVAIESVSNFALHRERNPDRQLRFRFSTNAAIGREQGAMFAAGQPGIVAWRRLWNREAGETEEIETANALRRWYRDLDQPTTVAADAWAALRRLVDDASYEQWLEFLTSFEWSTTSNQPPLIHAAIHAALVRLGFAADDNAVVEHHRTLFVHVIRLLSTTGEKRLIHPDVATALAAPRDRNLDDRIAALFERVSRVEGRVDALETRVSGIDSEVAAHRTTIDGALHAMLELLTSGDVPALTLDRITNPNTDAPAPTANRVNRAAAIAEIRSEGSSGWVALYGQSGSGKSQLAQLLAADADPSTLIWLRLTDVPPTGVALALRRAFEMRPQLSLSSDRSRVFRSVFRSEPPVRAIVLDDLPRLDSRDPVIEDLRTVASEAHDAGAMLISTSLHRLPMDVGSSLGARLREFVAPRFTDDETRELLIAIGASDEYGRALARLINTIGEGHSGLIVGIANYLRSCNWVVTADELAALLSGQHATTTRRELLRRLLTSVTEEQTRQLLYRMMLAVGDLSLGEVRGLAAAQPAIDRPDERLSHLEGLWVQVESDERVRVPAVVRLIRPDDLDERVRRFCLGRLAMMLLRRGTLTPIDVLKVVTYFTGAGAHHYAGLVLAQAFMELERLGPIPDSGLADWFLWPLPPEMPSGTKLLVRGTQIGMRLKWAKDIDMLLRDVETILDETTDPFEQCAVFITSGKLLTSDPQQSWRALPLLRRAMAAYDASRDECASVVPIPESLWIESIWLAGNSVGTAPQLQEWQVTIDSLPPGRRALLDGRDDLELVFMAIANNFLLVEHRKAAQSQEWVRLIENMNDLSAWALRVNMPLLHAHAARITLITLGENLHDLDAAVAAARVAGEENVDQRSRGVIEAAMGKQFSLQNRWGEARQWFAQAMSRPVSQTPLYFQTLLAGANAEQDFSLPGSITYLRQAIAAADNVELHTAADRFSARAELAIALFLADELEDAINLWMDAGSMLLDIEPGDDCARGRIVLFLRLSCNFYFAAAGLPAAMQLATPEKRVPPPVIGQFEAELAPLGAELDGFWRARVQVLLAKIADGQSKRELANTWAGRALGSMAGGAEAPSVLREEAQRLADPGTGS